jgi:hypothetical protein
MWRIFHTVLWLLPVLEVARLLSGEGYILT